MNKIRHFILLFVLVMAFQTLEGQTPLAKLDSFFNLKTSRGELNGAIFVSDHGKILLKKAMGYSNFESKKEIADHTRFQFASISKTMTAVAILQLMERGKLKLDDKFVKYFPEFPFPEITIRHMLSHTSGLPDLNVFHPLVTSDPDRIVTNADIIPELVKNKRTLLFKPGERWSYCNMNFNLMGLLIEKLSGMNYQVYLSKFIFKPAKMNTAYIKTTLINASHQVNEAYYYDYIHMYSLDKVRINESFFVPRWKIQYYNTFGFNGAGSVYGTIDDLINFDRALYDGSLLKEATLTLAFTPTKLNDGALTRASIGIGKASYGLGWFIFDDDSQGKIVWHSGGRYGCQTMFLRNITKKQLVVVLDNNESQGVYEAAVSAMNIVNDKPEKKHKRSLTKVYALSLIKGGADLATSKILELRSDTGNYVLREADMNNLGYEFSANGFQLQALETFRMNAVMFPTSDNAYDSYAESLLLNGKRKEAELMYEKALTINPKNVSSKTALENIRK